MKTARHPRSDTWVTYGSAELAVSTYGQGTSIVALHAGVCDRRSWQWCAPVWAEHGYRTVVYDRRGFGDTRFERETYDSLADLRAVTAATGASPAVVVGNSMGGSLAVDLALAYADEVSTLVLIGSLPSGTPFETWQTSQPEAALEAEIDAAVRAGDRARVNELEVHYWLDGPAQAVERVRGEPRRLMLEMNGRALELPSPGDDADRPEAWSRLEDLVVPTLLVLGEYDEVGLGPLAETMAARIPEARIERLPGTAHCPMLDRPDALARVVLDFVRTAAT